MNRTKFKSRSSVNTKTMFGLAWAAHGVGAAQSQSTVADRTSMVKGRIGPRSIVGCRFKCLRDLRQRIAPIGKTIWGAGGCGPLED